MAAVDFGLESRLDRLADADRGGMQFEGTRGLVHVVGGLIAPIFLLGNMGSVEYVAIKTTRIRAA
ncbi:MAG: hypothetical protein WBM09_11805 [Gallionella sp.]